MQHRDARELFGTDEEFANFRGLVLHNERSSVFFRSASSVRNYYGRAGTVQTLMCQYGIRTIIDLASIECGISTTEFGVRAVSRIRRALNRPAPYIVQCDAGKKRTGFVCMILEALSGTSRELIIDDFLESYRNNNGLTILSGTSEYKRCVQKYALPRLEILAKYMDSQDLAIAAHNYLATHGMTDYDIDKLHHLLAPI